MGKRMAVMAAMIVTALGVGVGVTSTTNPTAQAAMVGIGGLLVWGLVTFLSRAGEVWRFTAPYNKDPEIDRKRPLE
jgi:hypothetical protein